ncbi:MAG: DEAD/DEAH box helicase [Desulforhopalus sp.]|nr:DEAD/DEAH box helicase [Desulforhopalus sp.]
MSFVSLGISDDLLRALADQGFTAATKVQLQAIPAILSGRDVMMAAQTGTGKTAAFAVPLLQLLAGRPGKVRPNHIRALIVAPTRELAIQIAEAITACGRYLSLKTTVAYGGVKINPQMMRLRGGVDILIATPGRLLDLYQQNAVKFEQVHMLVLDEADRMLDLGFLDEIGKILHFLPGKRQNVLVSATFPDAIRSLAEKLLKHPLLIEAAPRNSAAKTVKQIIYEVDKSKKAELLCHLLLRNDWQQVLVFTGTRIGADRLAQRLTDKGVTALAIHGDKSQGTRSRALAEFKANAIRVLIATDIASRGIDISELSHVINVDLPKVAEDYIHRIGRTGRAGLEGVAISLVSADEVLLLSAIETLLQKLLPREVVAGFIPSHPVPITRSMKARPKKPKKSKPQHEDLQGQILAVNQTTPGRREDTHRKPRKGAAAENSDKTAGITGNRRHQRKECNGPQAASRRNTSLKKSSGGKR